jgi:vacuolar protein sorting-associated protein 35
LKVQSTVHTDEVHADHRAVITKVFPDEYHLHTLDQLLSAIARLNPHVDMKKIVMGLMDRLSTYAQRESGEASAEDQRKAEEDAAIRMLEKVDLNEEPKPAPSAEPDTPKTNGSEPKSPTEETQTTESEPATPAASVVNGDKAGSGVGEVRLFEIFYDQVVSLVKTRGLPIQDTMALLTSLANLAL